MADFRFGRKLCHLSGRALMADMAPEVKNSPQPQKARLTSRVDMWTLGCVLLHCACSFPKSPWPTEVETLVDTIQSDNSILSKSLINGRISLPAVATLEGIMHHDAMLRWTAKRALEAIWFPQQVNDVPDDISSAITTRLSVGPSPEVCCSRSTPSLPSRDNRATRRPTQAAKAPSVSSSGEAQDPSLVELGSEDPPSYESVIDTGGPKVSAEQTSEGLEVTFSGLALEESSAPTCAICKKEQSGDWQMAVYWCQDCGRTLMHE